MRPVICQSGKEGNNHSGLGFLLCNERPVQTLQIYGLSDTVIVLIAWRG